MLAHRLADGLGIVAVVLVAFHVRCHQVRTHEAYLTPELCNLAGPIVASGTGLHSYQTRRQLGQERQHLFTSQLLAQHHYSACVHPSRWKTLFAKSIPSVVTFIVGPSSLCCGDGHRTILAR